MFNRVRFILPLAVCAFLLAQVSVRAQEAEAIKGLRVYSCGHSFHFFVPPILADIAKKAKITDHKQIGLSAIGGSRVYQHWNKEKNAVKDELQAGNVDVLTLSPIFLPDDGIENFVKHAVKHNPKVRVTVQENWLPFDMYEPTFTQRPKNVDHNAPTVESLKKMHAPYFKSIDDHVVELNKKHGLHVFVAPVGQAVIALRTQIIAGKAPGLKEQNDLFTDPIGHARAPLQALVAYTHYASVYRLSPVGLPVPTVLARSPESEKLNRLLQEIAWEAVISHPLSGVRAPAGN